MSKRAVFFDIDGTLWDYEQKIPESLQTAMEKLHAAGNLGFICSGRTMSTITDERLLGIGFDGIVAGCGTHIMMKGETIFENLISWEELQTLKGKMQEAGIGIFGEGADKLYIDWEYFTGQEYAESFRKYPLVESLDAMNEASRINKLSIDYIGIPEETMLATFDPEKYTAIIHDMRNQGESEIHVAEIVPKGYTKATGIEWLCNHLGIEHAHTYAFGDGSNDVDMLSYVACGIAMENGNNVAKEAADVVCESVMDDGIYKELQRQGLFIRM